jgi:hypothetical protein
MTSSGVWTPNITSAFVFYSMLAFEDLLEAMLRDLEVPIPSNRTCVDLTDETDGPARCQNFRPACR